MATKKHSARHPRNSKGQFTTRTYRRRTATTRLITRKSTRRHASASGRSSTGGGTSTKRIMTILGVGAAAIWLTHKVTGTTPLTPAQMAQPKLLTAPGDVAVKPAVGPTTSDGTAI